MESGDDGENNEKQSALPVPGESTGPAPTCPVDQTEINVPVFLSFESSRRLNSQGKHKEMCQKETQTKGNTKRCAKRPKGQKAISCK